MVARVALGVAAECGRGHVIADGARADEGCGTVRIHVAGRAPLRGETEGEPGIVQRATDQKGTVAAGWLAAWDARAALLGVTRADWSRRVARSVLTGEIRAAVALRAGAATP